MGARSNWFGWVTFSTLIIDTGVVTATQGLHIIAAETGTTDDLDTITPGYVDLTLAGNAIRPILIITADTGDIITVKHGTGNISLSSEDDFLLEAGKLLALLFDGTNWRDLQSSDISDGAPAGATIGVGSEGGSDDINVTIQLKDHNGNDLAIRGAVHFYLADDANGDTPSGTAPDGGIAIGTDGAMIEWTANLSGMLISESDGDIDITLIDSGTPTFYLIIVLPNGKLIASTAITFA